MCDEEEIHKTFSRIFTFFREQVESKFIDLCKIPGDQIGANLLTKKNRGANVSSSVLLSQEVSSNFSLSVKYFTEKKNWTNYWE
jgi:hypothetical protein